MDLSILENKKKDIEKEFEALSQTQRQLKQNLQTASARLVSLKAQFDLLTELIENGKSKK